MPEHVLFGHRTQPFHLLELPQCLRNCRPHSCLLLPFCRGWNPATVHALAVSIMEVRCYDLERAGPRFATFLLIAGCVPASEEHISGSSEVEGVLVDPSVLEASRRISSVTAIP